MENIKDTTLCMALGASSGAIGLAVTSACRGGACDSCFGCAGAGLGLLIIAAIKKMRGEKDHGMA